MRLCSAFLFAPTSKREGAFLSLIAEMEAEEMTEL